MTVVVGIPAVAIDFATRNRYWTSNAAERKEVVRPGEDGGRRGLGNGARLRLREAFERRSSR